MPSRKGKPNRIKGCYHISDIYEDYKKNVDKGSIFDISGPEFYDIVTSVFSEALDDAIHNNNVINVGSHLGEISCKKFKTSLTKPRLNYKVFNDTGYRVPHLNLHTRGYYAMFHWNKRKVRINNITWYSFKASRLRSRQLSALFGSGKTDYFEG